MIKRLFLLLLACMVSLTLAVHAETPTEAVPPAIAADSEKKDDSGSEDYDPYVRTNNEPLGEVYDRAAGSILRDWAMKECVDFSWFLNGSMKSIYDKEGILIDTIRRCVVFNTETGAALLPITYMDTDETANLMSILGELALQGINSVVLQADYEKPGILTKEEISSRLYYAMGMILSTQLHVDTQIPVYWITKDEGISEISTEDQGYIMLDYARLCHSYLSSAWVENSSTSPLDFALTELQANNFIRYTMKDYSHYSADHLSLDKGAYIYDSPDSLELLIKTDRSIHLFSFDNAINYNILAGYVVESFLMMSYDPWTYNLYYCEKKAGDKVWTMTALSDEEKNEAMSTFLQLNYYQMAKELFPAIISVSAPQETVQ